MQVSHTDVHHVGGCVMQETATLKLQEDLQHWHRRGQYQHNSTQQLPKMTLDQLRYSMSLVCAGWV